MIEDQLLQQVGTWGVLLILALRTVMREVMPWFDRWRSRKQCAANLQDLTEQQLLQRLRKLSQEQADIHQQLDRRLSRPVLPPEED